VTRRVGVLVATLSLVILAACGGGGRPSLVGKPTPNPTVAVPASDSLIAKATVPSLAVYSTPRAAQAASRFQNPWLLNNDPKLQVPLVMLVRSRQPSWVQVLLPIRPNGTLGWVKASTVTLEPDPYRITVALGAHQLTVYNGDAVLLQDTIADGAPTTPTPPGTYYIRVLLKAPDPNTIYGPYAYGLSGHSDALTTFDGGDAELGVHGNNDASVLGHDVTHGCIRMSNAKITYLAGILPLGTPVTIST
jgi:lipoprotein-anchoring transpeptidase ErfK/SrfK